MYDVGEDAGRLTAMLEALDGEALTVSAVDGYLTGLVLLREHVPVSEWMAHVWSKDARLESVREEALESALIGHYNGMAQKLASGEGTYGPLLQENPSTGEVSWDEWILGFASAAALHPAAWARIEACKEPDVVEAVEILEGLAGAASGEMQAVDKRFARIEPFVPAVICSIVAVLNGRKRIMDASEAVQVEPQLSAMVGEKAGPDRKGGWGLKRLYHRFCGIH